MPVDPLDALRQDDTGIDPGPELAGRIREQLVARLRTGTDRPADTERTIARSTTVTTTDTPTTGADDATASPAVTPYLAAHDAAGALDYYTAAFGAIESMRMTGDDGRIGHAEFTIGAAEFMLADEFPELGVLSPRSLGGSPILLYLPVADVDETFRRAVTAGGQGVRPPEDQTHGNRTATVVDPFGHRWMLSQPIGTVSIEELERREPGYEISVPERVVEVGYLTIPTPDVERARRFYGPLFGWDVEGDDTDGYGQITNTSSPMGFAPPTGGVADTGVVLYFRVDDVDRYATRVTELGGRVVSRAHPPSGRNARCVDDQGVPFDLWEAATGL